jgi:hypothetical protein
VRRSRTPGACRIPHNCLHPIPLRRTLTRSPLWASAFRPFYLLGSAYAPLLAAAWLAAWLGLLPTPGGMPLKLLHGHEFIFGFATAIILGIVVTALPSWAGTDEVHGARLACWSRCGWPGASPSGLRPGCRRRCRRWSTACCIPP